MLSLTLVFHRCGASLLRPLVSRLVDDGGATGTPTITELSTRTEVAARFGPLAGMREVSRFVQDWSDTQPDVEYLGVREA